MKKDFDREFFDGDSEKPWFYRRYDYETTYPPLKRMAIAIKNLYHPQRVLDIGCAKGFLVKAFRELGIEAFGIDVSEYAISKTFKDVRPFLFRIDANSDHLPFHDGFFDFITFLGTIEYLNNHRHVLKEINRVAKEGGILILKTLFKKVRGDDIRINIHDKKFWIRELKVFGFSYKPILASLFYRLYELKSYSSKQQGIKKKIGSFLWDNVPFGKKFLVWYLSRLVGYLLFTKEPLECTCARAQTQYRRI